MDLSQFDDYQHRAIATAAVRQKGRAGKVWAGLELASEGLELWSTIASLITKSQFRPKGKSEGEFKARLKDELGDALWTLAAVAEKWDLSLSKIAVDNLEKVGVKHAELVPVGEGGVKGVPDGAGPVPVAKPANPFPWLKGNKKAITHCPTCGTGTVFKEGCTSCPAPDCGWSAC